MIKIVITRALFCLELVKLITKYERLCEIRLREIGDNKLKWQWAELAELTRLLLNKYCI